MRSKLKMPFPTARHRPWAIVIAMTLGPGVLTFGLGARAAQEPTLETVLDRAAQYVGTYQRALGSVVIEEQYLQVVNGSWTRRLLSDLLVINTPAGHVEQWIAFRDVIEVDGTPVEDRQERLEQLFLKSPRITGALWQTLVTESARFNIGGIGRNVNVPTMALQLLESSDQLRISFEKTGERRAEGIAVWEVEFHELEPPSLIRSGQGGSLLTYGTIWVEPTTGRVVRTELQTEDEAVGLEIEIEVQYRPDPRLGIWVPAKMTEKYRLRNQSPTTSRLARTGVEIRCEATYSNFRRFAVEVDFELAPPQPH